MFNGEATIYSPLSDLERCTAEWTLKDLRDAVRPGEPEHLAKPLRLLFAGYRARPGDVDGMIAAYMVGLRGLPAWAVSEAVEALLQGLTSEDPQFMPAPGVVAQHARARLRGIPREITRLEQLLSARVMPTSKRKEATHGTTRTQA